ncbi:hypothetical protein ONS95_011668 [Cadophora gregata]|uniref:uncharacterized protein n=1 Tax=Cadophora gregata TaxID=51156 RepID=UPI0026DD54A7|nr:uncharacterized protein ONS95_011668 [Cadophora gregata]KAK0120263.1 hypothetical protein ONS95_011668 [Cadophora gregata]
MDHHSKMDSKYVSGTESTSDNNKNGDHHLTNIESVANGQLVPKVHFNLFAAIGV